MKNRVISFFAALLLLICSLPLTADASAASTSYTYIMAQKYSDIHISDKYIYFELDGKWGRADLNGAVNMEPVYSSLSEIMSKSAEAATRSSYTMFKSENGKYGYKNSSGQIVVEPIYDIASKVYDNGLAIVMYKGKYGIIDTSGKVRFDFVCDTLYKSDTSDKFAYTQDGRYGFISESCSVLCEPFLRAEAVAMYDDYAIFEASGGKYGMVGYDGTILCSAIWDFIRDFSEELAAVGVKEDFYGINVRWGYINKTGETVIPAIYDSYSVDALDFSGGLAGVCEGEYGFFINKTGEKTLSFKKGVYPYRSFSDGIAVIDDGYNKKYIDGNGEILIESNGRSWYDASEMHGSIASVTSFTSDYSATECGVIKYNGNLPSDWALSEVNAAIKAGIVPESLQNLYKSPMSRAEYCALAVTLIEAYTGEPIEYTVGDRERGSFVDTSDEAVLNAQALGIVQGRGNGVFDPDGIINRQEAARILVNTFKACAYLPGHTGKSPVYNDADSTAIWASEGIWYTAEWKVMIGVGDNMFDPTGSYTREQSILTMIRLYNTLLQNRPQELYIHPDVSGVGESTVGSLGEQLDCVVTMTIPSGWTYDYAEQSFYDGETKCAQLSNACIYSGTLPDEESEKGVYSWTSGSLRVTMRFEAGYYDRGSEIAQNVRLYDRAEPSIESDTAAHMTYVYEKAYEAMSWFRQSTLYSRASLDNAYARLNDSLGGFEIDEEGYITVRDALIKNYAALEKYLKGIFSDEIVKSLLSDPVYKDENGVLKGLSFENAADTGKNVVDYSYRRMGDGKIIYTLKVELIDAATGRVSGSENCEYTYENTGSGWKWTEFSLFN